MGFTWSKVDFSSDGPLKKLGNITCNRFRRIYQESADVSRVVHEPDAHSTNILFVSISSDVDQSFLDLCPPTPFHLVCMTSVLFKPVASGTFTEKESSIMNKTS